MPQSATLEHAREAFRQRRWSAAYAHMRAAARSRYWGTANTATVRARLYLPPRAGFPRVQAVMMQVNEFEDVVFEAMDRLPGWVHDALDNVRVLVLDEPDAELDPDGEGLLGLYIGTPLPERGVDYAGELPDVVYIFRRPHLELGLSRDELRDEIARTLIHEIAHYFGIEDEYLEEIGWG